MPITRWIEQETCVAKSFALLAHESISQKRKYGSGVVKPEPYYFHPLKVASLVESKLYEDYYVDEDNDTKKKEIISVIEAAAMHDIIEDVSPLVIAGSATTPFPNTNSFMPKEMVEGFGSTTVGLILEVTNVYTKSAAAQQIVRETVHALKLSVSDKQLDDMFELANLSNRALRKQYEAKRLATISPLARLIKMADLFDNAHSMVGAPEDFKERWFAEKAELDALLGKWEDLPEQVTVAWVKENLRPFESATT